MIHITQDVRDATFDLFTLTAVTFAVVVAFIWGRRSGR